MQNLDLNFLQRCKSSIDNKGFAGALFKDLSKAFDSVDHDLLFANLNAYGINLDALQLLRSYFSKRLQRVKVNSTFSDWNEIRFGVPRGSALGPLLFNVFVNEIFCLSGALTSVTMLMIQLSLHAIQLLKLY